MVAEPATNSPTAAPPALSTFISAGEARDSYAILSIAATLYAARN
jgi:hypothetical protein